MNSRQAFHAARGLTSVNALLAVGFSLIFVLALVLGLQTAGLLGLAWYSAFAPPVVSIVSVKQTCIGEISPQGLVSSKGKTGSKTPISVSLECQPKVEVSSAEKTREQIASPNTADTLSVLGVVVALVTLMLTLGSTHLAQKQRELELLMVNEQKRQELEDLLIQAQVDVFEYFLEQQPSVAAQNTIDCGLRLRLLQSSDETQRKAMSEKLSNLLGPGNSVRVPCVVQYVNEVKRLLASKELTRGQRANISFLDKPLT